MLAIRLKRVGRTNDPSFRIIVQDHRRSPKKTRGVVEYVGSYDARKGSPVIDGEKVKFWMSRGAKPSPTVHNLLVDAKVISEKKVNAHNKKTKPAKEEPKVEAPKAPVQTEAPTLAAVQTEAPKEEVAPAEVEASKPEVPADVPAEAAVDATTTAE